MHASEYNKILPNNILRIIQIKGFKTGTIAKKSGFSQRMFSDMLYGRRIIRAGDIIKISNALGVTPNEIFKTYSTAELNESINTSKS